jgi:hypothetical protein
VVLAGMAAAVCTLDTAAAECTVTTGCVVTVDAGRTVTGAAVMGDGAAAAEITGDTVAKAAGEAQEAVAACMVAVDRRAVVPAIRVAVAGAARDSGAADSAAGGKAVEDQAAGVRAVGAETDEATVRGTSGDATAVEWDLAGQVLVAGNSEEEGLPAEILEAEDSAAADLARRASVAKAMTDSAPGNKTATTAIVPPSVDLAADQTPREADPEMKENAANGLRFVLAEMAAGQALIDPKPVAQAARQKAMTPARGADRIAAAALKDRRAAAVTARDQTAADQTPAAANSADRATTIGASHTARQISSSRCCFRPGYSSPTYARRASEGLGSSFPR